MGADRKFRRLAVPSTVVEEGPVEGKHAQLGQAHAEVVEVIGSERDLQILRISGRQGGGSAERTLDSSVEVL